ncbi:hypothetical protein ASPSYDRAFT_81153 [Aspergillus sydowii CBS 593.65]|uniref:FAD/NAD(P)-binding domain-containing protein n=1 Tax=Aspergillus sydowii CBS 593.65 TaxID=1036612 RepID=A0A1L9T638_9EURO|nr:uncharacterized protein ASPSYDRAFT_81153 [Aspergillus sydowii CBS 593.65]OJJ54896.1 hypothetical protein ASPSYDRAFT_81153 [Aspergillus sydowii CBS 593.65]
MNQETAPRFDVVIVGAGISGINAAYRLQTELPSLSYTILEARNDIGGTWDLFKYPGIRSDSDLFTFGFAFNPWKQDNPIASGDSIQSYVRGTAKEFGIESHIQYRNRLCAAEWSSSDNQWSLTVDCCANFKTYIARFVVFGTGYYDYNELASKGQVVHPQFWPQDVDYKDKKIIIIGSGATAVTLLPKLAEQAKHVIMLQRSPTYIMSLSNRSPTRWLSYILPPRTYHHLQRILWFWTSRLFYPFCRGFPRFSRWMITRAMRQELPEHIPQDPHFSPRYSPWDQRLCFCPDGDFFRSLQSGRASVRTDTVKTVNTNGILLNSNECLEADIIITATGLKLQMAGGATLAVDGEKVDISTKYLWKGVMMQDLPNALVCRLLRTLQSRQMIALIPRLEPKEASTLGQRKLLNINATYVAVAERGLPKAGDRGAWQPRDNYVADLRFARRGNLDDGLEFIPSPEAEGRSART